MNRLIMSAWAAIKIIAVAVFVISEEAQHQLGLRNYNRSTNNHRPVPPSASGRECRNRPKQKRTVKIKNGCCSFCREDLTGDIEILACHHAHHAQCMAEYLKVQSRSRTNPVRCPLCREMI